MTDWQAHLRANHLAETPEQASRLAAYLALLTKWTAKTNLVATGTKPDDLIHLHVNDSLALLPHLDQARRILDVGSGGGLPGAILAIARPDLQITALEPIHKKHAFLATLRRELPLPNFTPRPERDDQHRTRPDFQPYDLAVSRAVFAPAEWLERALPLVKPGGLILAMEGRDLIDLPPGTERHPYDLADRRRAILKRTRP